MIPLIARDLGIDVTRPLTELSDPEIAQLRQEVQTFRFEEAERRGGIATQRQKDTETRRLVRESLAAQALVDEIRTISERVNTFGPIQRLVGSLGRISGLIFQSDPDIVELKSLEGFLGNLARSLGGERGVLTNQDIDRVQRLIPGIHTTKEVARRNIQRIQRIINAGLQRARQQEFGGESQTIPTPTSPAPTTQPRQPLVIESIEQVRP